MLYNNQVLFKCILMIPRLLTTQNDLHTIIGFYIPFRIITNSKLSEMRIVNSYTQANSW